ncbi:DUF1802 family protein [Kovacikia minuta CCNUW1]|uniref:DUF1802 family protein n=1 Tax=Kovacikia minuta TaxID=2931930 RepID=UPI001CCD2C02|nr:DUF1802 family protein [Kovacikia minuta]UBF24560.1 DUF1802 family protein [Kovacikia minuta CCNUW1]
MSTSINTALCLPASDVAALSKGRMIAALSRTFVSSTQQFALCPIEEQGKISAISIDLWAKPEFCKVYSDLEDIDKLAQITIWSKVDLKKAIQERFKLFLLCLRVFQAPQAVVLLPGGVSLNKIGSFIKLPGNLSTSHSVPILDDDFFTQRKQQLINLEPSNHSELEELQKAISSLAIANEDAKSLDNYIQTFLGWINKPIAVDTKQKLDWIYKIDALGRRSKELDQDKSNYQAGTDFENIVRDSLEFLGFSIDEAYKGGAGGLDLFCSKPYPLVGECKSGKRIPSGTTEELLKLGGMRLSTDQFLESSKLIIGPGNPTQDLLTAAAKWKVSIINPMSLQKLVELQAKYPGSVNLIELKKYLEPGQIDYRIDEYIEKVSKEIKLRSHIIQSIKQHLSQTKAEDASVDILFGVYCGSNPPQVLALKDFQEILIELSSPLVGYLGRIRSHNSQSDRFYFLRDFPID